MGTTVGICGGGIGGLVAALALRDQGIEAVVYEQAPLFGRVGADINLTPNAVRALDGLGAGAAVGAAIRESAARPTHRISRTWDTGEETSRLEMSRAAEDKYGAPQLTIHRADLLSALDGALGDGAVRVGHKVTAVHDDGDGVTVRFDGGGEDRVDLLVGADGIHSTVRTAMFGPENPTFTGVVAYRAVVPAGRLAGQPDLDAFTKWWGPDPDTQIVSFPLNRGRDIFVFATTPQDDWLHESWTQPGSVEELRASYADFVPDARRLLDACDEVMKSALYVRDPLPAWVSGRMVLLGDACHPMMPFMAQGAGQAIEDAVVLARCLGGIADRDKALHRYQEMRRDRTARIQIGSRSNDWLKVAGDADWVYGYDAWAMPVA